MPITHDVRMDLRSLADLPPIQLPDGYSLVSAPEWAVPDVEARWVGLLARAFPEIASWDPLKWRERFAAQPHYDPAGTFFVVNGSECVATAFAWQDDPADGDCGRVHWVGTHPDHRGKGLGRAITLAVLHYLAERGFRRAFLATQLYRGPAIRVYVKLGFVPSPQSPEEEVEWDEVMARIGAGGTPQLSNDSK